MAGEDDAIERIIKENIEEYAARYTGRTKIKRLRFIAEKCGIPGRESVALRMAYEEIKNGEDTRMFKEVVAKIDGRLDPMYGPDDAWVNEVDRRAELKEEKLKNDLAAYKTTLVHGPISEITLNEERVRMGFIDLGDFYYGRGQLDEALDIYGKASMYCTTANRMVALEKCILVSIEMGKFGYVASFVSVAGFSLDTITIAKLGCAAGLAYLKDKHYSRAAEKFVQTSPQIQKSYSEVIADPDIAIYGGLCALASFTPSELEGSITDNRNFQKFLKLVPQIKKIINKFCSGEYASSLELLSIQKSTMLQDFYLHEHAEELFEEIRKRALINYTLQNSSVDIPTMANAFKKNVTALEKELKPLIATNQIHALFETHIKYEE